MFARKILAIAALALVGQLAAGQEAAAQGRSGSAPGVSGVGGGFGAAAAGRGNAGRRGGAGAPMPLLGVTLLGQAAGAAGLLTLWRRRRKGPHKS